MTVSGLRNCIFTFHNRRFKFSGLSDPSCYTRNVMTIKNEKSLRILSQRFTNDTQQHNFNPNKLFLV